MPANPAYLMALPTKIDPMLGYLTTGYQDHVRLREKFGYKVNDGMWQFFQELGVIDANGKPTEHFGDPLWVYLQYRHRKGDTRADEAILAEGRTRMQEIRSRGVFLAEGYGKHPGKLEPSLRKQIDRIYEDAKVSIWAELTPAFVANVPDHLLLKTQSVDREDYILHPTSGEVLSEDSVQTVRKLRAQHEGKHDVQIVISDGLNAFSIMDQGHLDVFLKTLRTQLAAAGYHPAKENLVVNSGRVRAGYRIGELLFADVAANRAILHIIGERPGTGHHTFSVYMTAPAGNVWGQPGKVDHNITKVVSGIATTALVPEKGAEETVRLLQKMAPM
jgi:ethanolamine ammonia-lyase large subunit